MEHPLTRRRILVADDNSDAASSLGMLLEMMGHEVCIVHNGVEAVEKATTFEPDIILLDLGMPQLNGYEACARIREQPSHKRTLIVALTGWVLGGGIATVHGLATPARFFSELATAWPLTTMVTSIPVEEASSPANVLSR